MPTWAWIVIVIAAVAVVGAVAWSAVNARRRKELQERFVRSGMELQRQHR